MEYKGIKLRHEKKYFVSHENKEILCRKLASSIKVDENAGENNTYKVTSLYFDDMYDNSYHSKLSGIRDRHKYRIRIYKGDASRLILEKKVKHGEYIGKISRNINKEVYNAIYTGRDIEVLLDSNDELLREVFIKIRTARLSPKVIVEYDREAYVCEHGNVRITFDKDLRAGLHNIDIAKNNYDIVSAAADENKVIMEVKFDNYLPSIVRNALSETGREHLSISKYIICSDLDNLYGGNIYHGKHTIIPRHI